MRNILTIFFAWFPLYFYRSKCKCQQQVRKQTHGKEVFRCRLCTTSHSLRYCTKFLRMDTEERNRVVRKFDYCVNCLAQSHSFCRCESKNTCRKCSNHHHTLLHRQHPRVKPPSVYNQEVQPYRKSHRVSRKTQKPNRKTPAARKQKEVNAVPNPRILSEAIRSLASVLCVTHSST